MLLRVGQSQHHACGAIVLQMLLPRLCHTADERQASDDNQATYVMNVRVTLRKGVTPSCLAE